MTIARVQTHHRIAMPEDVFRKVQLHAGDLLEVEMSEGRIVLTPISATESPGWTAQERARLEPLRRKMDTIRRDLASAPGLTQDEADLAVRAGWLDASESWWWMDTWLEGEREAEQDIREGRTRGFTDADALFEDLAD